MNLGITSEWIQVLLGKGDILAHCIKDFWEHNIF